MGRISLQKHRKQWKLSLQCWEGKAIFFIQWPSSKVNVIYQRFRYQLSESCLYARASVPEQHNLIPVGGSDNIISYGWEGDRRSGIALAMRVYPPRSRPKEGRWAPRAYTYTPHGVPYNTLYLHMYIGWRWRNFVTYLCQFTFAAIL